MFQLLLNVIFPLILLSGYRIGLHNLVLTRVIPPLSYSDVNPFVSSSFYGGEWALTFSNSLHGIAPVGMAHTR